MAEEGSSVAKYEDHIPEDKRKTVFAAERCLKFQFDKLLKSLLASGSDSFDPKIVIPADLQGREDLQETFREFRFRLRGSIMREVHTVKHQMFFLLQIVATDGRFPAEFYDENYRRQIFNKADGQAPINSG